jgi:hypothetical protein
LLSGRLAAADRFARRFHEEKATYFVETLPYITVSLAALVQQELRIWQFPGDIFCKAAPSPHSLRALGWRLALP